jgi:hypothetical protein
MMTRDFKGLTKLPARQRRGSGGVSPRISVRQLSHGGQGYQRQKTQLETKRGEFDNRMLRDWSRRYAGEHRIVDNKSERRRSSVVRFGKGQNVLFSRGLQLRRASP